VHQHLNRQCEQFVDSEAMRVQVFVQGSAVEPLYRDERPAGVLTNLGMVQMLE
jgi:hypothetical protein